MSLYNNSNSPGSFDSPTQQLSWVEVTSNPSVPNGSSQISMRWNSSPSRVWVPGSSYVVLKLTLGTAFTNVPLESQINDFPANRLFQRMQISADSNRLESNDDCSTIAQLYTDLESSFAGRLSHVRALSKQGLLVSGDTEITLCFVPHLSLFRLGYVLNGGSWELTLFPKSATGGADFIDSMISSVAAATAAATVTGVSEQLGLPNTTITGRALGVTNATACTITGCSLMAAYASPNMPSPMDGPMQHLLSVYNTQVHEPTATAVNHTVTIPPSTFYVSMFIVLKATTAAENQGAVQGGLLNYQLRYGSNVYPFSPINSLVTSGDQLRSYVDTVNSRNSLDLGDEFPRTFDQWKAKPVYGHRIYKSSGDSPTQMNLRANFNTGGNATAARIIIVCHSHELLNMSYANDGELVATDVVPIV